MHGFIPPHAPGLQKNQSDPAPPRSSFTNIEYVESLWTSSRLFYNRTHHALASSRFLYDSLAAIAPNPKLEIPGTTQGS